MKNKKTLWIVLAVVLIGILLIILTNRNEKTFQPTPFSNNNIVGNRATKDYLDTIVSVGLDLLDIKGVSVLIQDMDTKIEIGEYDVKAYIIGKNKQYIIKTNSNLSRNMAITVMSHEIIHLLQTEKFQLVKNGNSIMWMNTIYKNANDIPYGEREWEREAFIYGRLLEKEVRKKLYNDNSKLIRDIKSIPNR